jgi:predicted pyridoxine 5'-phosphate oxidase superfamily flavin-nucleotide-binding protein
VSVFHPGEVEVQTRLDVRDAARAVGRGVGPVIPPWAPPFLRTQRMAIAATLDEQDRPWPSLLTGPPGFIQIADERLLRLATAPVAGDPLAANLAARPELALLIIDLVARRRLRANGRGLVSPDGLFLLADEVYGNCPKYIEPRAVVAESGEPPGAPRRSSSLGASARALVAAADTFFIATWHPKAGADASHRGGPKGFVRVRDDRTLEFPDYPGNNMFNTLGNLFGHPAAGLLFVDFERGDLVQIGGRARILWDPETAVRVDIDTVVEIPGGSPLRFAALAEPASLVTP